jgi:hypothetical protein
MIQKSQYKKKNTSGSQLLSMIKTNHQVPQKTQNPETTSTVNLNGFKNLTEIK